jgi:protein TonB
MRRLGLFFLLSVMTVFGAIVSMEQAVCLKAPAEEAAVHRSITLTLHAPPKPAKKAVPKPQPEPKKPVKAEPKPVQKKVSSKPKPQPKPKPVPKPVKAAEPEPEAKPLPKPPEEVPQQPQPTPAVTDTPEPPPQRSSAVMKALEDYYSRLYRRISENRRYPAQARRFGIEGEVGVAFEIDDSGRIVDSLLLEPSGSRLLDREAIQVFERISRFEAPPPGLGQRRFEVTIAYTLKH